MKTDFTIIRPDGTLERGNVDWPNDPGYDRIKTLIAPLVGGGIEHVSVLHNGRRTDMFVNETGGLDGLPANDKATAIYHAATRARGQSVKGAPMIYGTAILFDDRRVWF
jgi:hypothetical protein